MFKTWIDLAHENRGHNYAVALAKNVNPEGMVNKKTYAWPFWSAKIGRKFKTREAARAYVRNSGGSQKYILDLRSGSVIR